MLNAFWGLLSVSMIFIIVYVGFSMIKSWKHLK